MVTLNGHKDSIKFLENKIKRQLISLNYNLQINLKINTYPISLLS